MGDYSDSIRVNLAKFIALLHKEFKPSFEKSKKISPSLTKNQVRKVS